MDASWARFGALLGTQNWPQNPYKSDPDFEAILDPWPQAPGDPKTDKISGPRCTDISRLDAQMGAKAPISLDVRTSIFDFEIVSRGDDWRLKHTETRRPQSLKAKTTEVKQSRSSELWS